MKKTQITINNPVYLGLTILDLSKTIMYEFCHNYVKAKYCENVKMCYMDTDSFIVYVRTDGIYKDVAEDVETRFDTSNFKIDRPLLKGKNKKVIELMKNKLGKEIMTKFVEVRAKICSYLKDSNDEDKKAKVIKMFVIKNPYIL